MLVIVGTRSAVHSLRSQVVIGSDKRERRSLDILSVKKEARLSARALAEVKVGRGED